MKTSTNTTPKATGVLAIVTDTKPIEPDNFEFLLVPLAHKGIIKAKTCGGIEQDKSRTTTRIFFELGTLPSSNDVFFLFSDLHILIGDYKPDYLLLFHDPYQMVYTWWHCRPESVNGIHEEELSQIKTLKSRMALPIDNGLQLICAWDGARESAGLEQWFDAGCPEPGWTPIPI